MVPRLQLVEYQMLHRKGLRLVNPLFPIDHIGKFVLGIRRVLNGLIAVSLS